MAKRRDRFAFSSNLKAKATISNFRCHLPYGKLYFYNNCGILGYYPKLSVSASSKNETLDEATAQSKTPAIHTAENELEEELTTRSQVHTERGTGTRGQQFAHTFSQPVIIVIIFGVMAGIIGTILLVSYGIGRLQKKTLLQEQPPFSNDEGPPLSSVETGNPEM
ncbi:glycophorin-A [Pteropus medius]|uniref:glycophorin-A n=1 Tax=Pteropus vampyrus TaxID=132908 RepID=UPI00196AD5F6|nr:glycophorin-A [Pteropus giganteus]